MKNAKLYYALTIGGVMLANSIMLPISTAEAAYVQTVNMKDYNPFEGMEADESNKETEKEKDPAQMTFKERMAAKRAAEEKANAPAKAGMLISKSGVKQGNAYIPGGLKIKAELLQPVSSKGYKVGTLLKIKVLDNVVINDVVVVEKGSEGTAYIYQARKAGGLGRKGKLKVAGNEIFAVNGIPIPLRGGLIGQGKTDGGAGAVFAAVSIVGGLFMKGSNINYQAGTAFEVEVREDTDLGCKVEDLAKSMDPKKPHGIQVTIR